MTGKQPRSNQVKIRRRSKGWSQAELARQVGISRAAVSAIEQARLAPSVVTALSLAEALGCTVEELFSSRPASGTQPQWAWEAPYAPFRYWQAEVGGKRWLYPLEATNVGERPHDGVWTGKELEALEGGQGEKVLVIATCDPAVNLLAAEYARQTPFRLLPLVRSSRDSLQLLKEGKIHAAGVHLSSSKTASGNADAVRERCGPGYRLARIGVWQEGIALAPHLNLRSTQAATRARLHWVGREEGSGARQCFDELLPDRRPPRRIASDHRGVAMAIRCGWADAGVCLRLASEEAGLGFLELRREPYDLCFPADWEDDPRLRELVSVIGSTSYRRQLNYLPGYDASSTGGLQSC